MSQLRSRPLYQGTKPVRDPAYLRFIRALPCVACLRTWSIDPAFDTDPREFAETWKLDIPALIARFNEFYRTKLKGRAA